MAEPREKYWGETFGSFPEEFPGQAPLVNLDLRAAYEAMMRRGYMFGPPPMQASQADVRRSEPPAEIGRLAGYGTTPIPDEVYAAAAQQNRAAGLAGSVLGALRGRPGLDTAVSAVDTTAVTKAREAAAAQEMANAGSIANMRMNSLKSEYDPEADAKALIASLRGVKEGSLWEESSPELAAGFMEMMAGKGNMASLGKSIVAAKDKQRAKAREQRADLLAEGGLLSGAKASKEQMAAQRRLGEANAQVEAITGSSMPGLKAGVENATTSVGALAEAAKLSNDLRKVRLAGELENAGKMAAANIMANASRGRTDLEQAKEYAGYMKVQLKDPRPEAELIDEFFKRKQVEKPDLSHKDRIAYLKEAEKAGVPATHIEPFIAYTRGDGGMDSDARKAFERQMATGKWGG